MRRTRMRRRKKKRKKKQSEMILIGREGQNSEWVVSTCSKSP